MTAGRLILLCSAAVLCLPALAAASGPGVSESQISDFIYRILNFLVMVTVVIIVARKPVKSGLAGRAKAIKEELSELEAKREEAQREFAVMEQRLQDAAQERQAIIEEFKAQGEREKAKIIEGAHTLAERLKSQAQFAIEQETKQAKAELRREIADLSAALAEDLVKEKINADDQKRLVKDYLAKVGQEVQ